MDWNVWSIIIMQFLWRFNSRKDLLWPEIYIDISNFDLFYETAPRENDKGVGFHLMLKRVQWQFSILITASMIPKYSGMIHVIKTHYRNSLLHLGEQEKEILNWIFNRKRCLNAFDIVCIGNFNFIYLQIYNTVYYSSR